MSEQKNSSSNLVLAKFMEPINLINSKIKNNKLYAFTLVGTV